MADGENNHVWTALARRPARCSRASGAAAATAGQLHWIHNMAVDSRGNIYTAEVDNAKRVQKFKPTNGVTK